MKRFWAKVAIGAVSAGSIVVHFNVLEFRLSHEFACLEALAMNEHHLQGVKEALDNGVIIAIAFWRSC